MMNDPPVILIVDDDTDTRDLVGRLLTSAGYAVRFACNGWEGLLALEQPVDLILLDIMMPGMDGVTFLRSLRQQRAGEEVPVVIMTALDRAEIAPRVQRYNVSAILLKDGGLFPDLKAVLMRTLAKPRPQARVMLPEQGSLIRPFLDLYMETLAWG